MACEAAMELERISVLVRRPVGSAHAVASRVEVAALDDVLATVNNTVPTAENIASHALLRLGIAQTSLALRSTSAKVSLNIVEAVNIGGDVMDIFVHCNR